MENKNKVIDLGNGFIYEKGEVKEVMDENCENNKEWMTWDEGWKWVIDSLKKIHDISDDMLLQKDRKNMG